MTEHEEEIHYILMPFWTHKIIPEHDLEAHCTANQIEMLISEGYIEIVSKTFWGISYRLTTKAKELLFRKK